MSATVVSPYISQRDYKPQPVNGEDGQAPLTDTESEASLLGIVLENSDAVLGARLVPDDFSDFRLRLVARTIRTVSISGQRPAPEVIVPILRDSGQLNEAGGLAFVSGLGDAPPPSGIFDQLFNRVANLATRRACLADFDLLKLRFADPSTNLRSLASAAAASFTALAEATGQAADQFPAFDDAWQLIEQSMPTPPAIVDGLLRRGEKCVLGGASKSFKSWAALDLAVSVSHGLPWLGREVLPGNVLFVNLELPKWCIRKRTLDIANARGIRIDAGKLLLWTLRGERIAAEQLLQTLTDRKPDNLALVIIDPAYKLLDGRDENSAGDIGSLLNVFERITETTGAAICIPTHFAKGNASGKESMDRISGSGVFARDPDSILTMTRHEEEDAFAIEATLRTFPPVAPFVVKWCHPVFSVANLDPEKLKQAKRPGPAKKHTAEDALKCLPAGGLKQPEWQRACYQQRNISRSRFYDLARELEDAGRVSTGNDAIVRISQEAKGTPYADE